MNDVDEQLARTLVSRLAAGMEESIDEGSKLPFQVQGFKKEDVLQLRMMMMKVANRKKAAVTRALIHCLDNFFTIKEMKAFMKSEFKEASERESFQAGIQGILKIGKRAVGNEEGALYVQAYLRFSGQCEKNRMQGRVRALQKDQNK